MFSGHFQDDFKSQRSARLKFSLSLSHLGSVDCGGGVNPNGQPGCIFQVLFTPFLKEKHVFMKDNKYYARYRKKIFTVPLLVEYVWE